MPYKPIAAGRRKHHPIFIRDTADNNHMFVVRDEKKRKEALERETQARQTQQPIVDSRHVIRQVDNPETLKIHEHQKGEGKRTTISTTFDTTFDELGGGKPRKGWR